MSAPSPTARSPFLEGLLAPVYDERDDPDLEVTGQVPAGLSGRFVRNGPNPRFDPGPHYHPFDGDGMVHVVDLQPGRSRYRNRWIESAGLRVERDRGEAVYGGLGELKPLPAEVIAAGGMIKNTANTHTVRHAGRLLALLEACPPTWLSDDLETLGEYDFDGGLAGPMTAHPKIDPATGEMVCFGYQATPPYLRYHVITADGVVDHSIEIDLAHPVMIHDFAVTENWTIFLDAPAVLDLTSMLGGGPLVRWRPELGTRIGIVRRRGAPEDITWIEVDNHYVVHYFNAWEADGRIELRAPRFPSMPGAFDFSGPTDQGTPVPWRWSIDPITGVVDDEPIDDRPGEFPRINDDHAGRPTRYLYNCLARTWAFEFEFNGIVKYDALTGTAEEFFYADSEVSGEHAFAPDPDGTAEDDGWLLSFVTDRATEQSDLVVLDARDVSRGPVARVHIPRRVPLGFHANWYPTAPQTPHHPPIR